MAATREMPWGINQYFRSCHSISVLTNKLFSRHQAVLVPSSFTRLRRLELNIVKYIYSVLRAEEQYRSCINENHSKNVRNLNTLSQKAMPDLWYLEFEEDRQMRAGNQICVDKLPD